MTAKLTNTPRAPTRRATPGCPGSPATPNWPRCPARNWSNSAASSTASRSSTRKTAGRSPAPRLRSAPNARSRIWLLLGGLSGLALLVVFLFWPWEYSGGNTPGQWWYDLATPLYGLTFGLSILAIGVGAVLYQKKFIPEEISIQERHDGRSPEIQRKTAAANLTDALETSTIKRRKLIGLSLGIGLGAFGVGTLVAFIGGLIKNPWKPVVQTADGKKAVLWTSGWTPRYQGETIFVTTATGKPGESPFIKVRPEDIDAGGMLTVFPWRESDGDGTTVESHERLSEIAMGVRNPVMLIRIKPGDANKVVKRQGQESFNFGDLFAFTKVSRIWVVPHRFTSSRPIASFARAISRNSICCTSQHPFSARLRARWRSCPSPSTRTGTWSPTATSASPLVRHSGNGKHYESETAEAPSLAEIAAGQGDAIDSRYHPSAAVRRQLNKVFPTHWSFLLGEIALYSFIVLLLTGVYLRPVLRSVHGRRHLPRRVSAAAWRRDVEGLRIHARHQLRDSRWLVRPSGTPLGRTAFRGGDHADLARIFFTGAFRRPRETNTYSTSRCTPKPLSETSTVPLQQLRQLGDVGGDAPGFVLLRFSKSC